VEVETSQEEGGTRITVHTDQKVAIIVESGQGERIYLPPAESDQDGYYVENPSSLKRSEDGYTVLHMGEIINLKVLN
jgi:hypothetical protein